MFDTDIVYSNYYVAYTASNPFRLYQTFVDAQNGSEVIIRSNNGGRNNKTNSLREEMLESVDKCNGLRDKMLEMVGLV
jgi:hypothetical protein